MTAQEKFEARLRELGLEGQYEDDGHVGAVLPDGRVIVLVHIEYEDGDPYSEFEYPPYDELWKNEKFRQACKDEYYEYSADDEFIANLARWLDIHGKNDKCPLFPVDLYWLGVPATKWFNYEDDLRAEEIINAMRLGTK